MAFMVDKDIDNRYVIDIYPEERENWSTSQALQDATRYQENTGLKPEYEINEGLTFASSFNVDYNDLHDKDKQMDLFAACAFNDKGAMNDFIIIKDEQELGCIVMVASNAEESFRKEFERNSGYDMDFADSLNIGDREYTFVAISDERMALGAIEQTFNTEHYKNLEKELANDIYKKAEMEQPDSTYYGARNMHIYDAPEFGHPDIGAMSAVSGQYNDRVDILVVNHGQEVEVYVSKEIDGLYYNEQDNDKGVDPSGTYTVGDHEYSIYVYDGENFDIVKEICDNTLVAADERDVEHQQEMEAYFNEIDEHEQDLYLHSWDDIDESIDEYEIDSFSNYEDDLLKKASFDPPIIEGHEGDRTLGVYEISSIEFDNSESYAKTLSAEISTNGHEQDSRQDIVILVGPEEAAVYVKLDIADCYADRCGLDVGNDKDKSNEENRDDIIKELGGTTYTFGESEYVKDIVPSDSVYEFSASCMVALKEAADRDNPERLHDEPEIERNPEFNGR